MDCCNRYVGLDEVGRGPLAGPVTVAGVFVLPEFLQHKPSWYQQIKDSKKLSSGQRSQLNGAMYNDDRLLISVHSSSAKFIDKHGIIEALHRASLGVIDDILEQLQVIGYTKNVDIILDGNHEFRLRNVLFRHDGTLRAHTKKIYRQMINVFTTRIRGDDSIRQIAAASIIAKVWRDQYMSDLSKRKRYRDYRFERHKGYGTVFHRQQIV